MNRLVGQLVAEKYHVRSVLGTGGMGTVFEAQHVAIGRIVAIKILNREQTQNVTAVKRFHQEAWAAGAIGHANLCSVYDVGALPDGSPYIVMERLYGQTLAERINEHTLQVREAVDIVLQVLAGLVAVHARGILHRDIKPENVMLSEQPGYPTVAKLLDFGVSKIVSGGPGEEWDDKSALTKTGIVMGTPYYVSPEQARALRDLDARVDVYACGILLYEGLTKRKPFEAPHYNALLLRILQGDPTPVRNFRNDVSPELEQVIAKAMAANRDHRYPTAHDMARALVAVRPAT